MYIDNLLTFAKAQALAATGALTNVIDLGSDRDIGPGKPMWVVFAIGVAAAGTTPTFQFDLQTDDNASFSSPTSIATLSPAAASMVAGARFVMGVPYANERYLRVNATLGGTAPTVTLDAFLTDQEPASWQAYSDGLTT